MLRLRQNLVPYGFLLPYLLIFLLFWAYPLVQSLIDSFDDSRILGFAFSTTNWTRLFADPFFMTALKNTLIILAIQVPFMLALAISLAIAMNSQMLKAKGFYRFAFFAPLVVGTTAYSAIFRLIFNTQYGAVNHGLNALGLPSVDWLNQGTPALIVIMLAITWRWTGYNAIILLAGLQSISKDVYEAAAIDGASKWTTFWRITLPLMRPSILFCMVLSVFGTLQLFTESALITAGGPGNATMTLGTYLYQQGFRSFNFGYASSIAYAVAILGAFVSWIQLRLLGRDNT
ncbi:carbohydrate ABC transporter permease [Deinococcus cellulosilyticus]|uniref:Lactose ABC transporter permease n=1 Tax=Deinococcus cellulosilyticus (strain DSM 18568 / NBRC 106333 / KACC 11606 / 5516J-15) TaxID=1223518 RepID=A0A511MXL8_DEIC1|nr:sugar ABC transporter permease [Deinococcus cellulosilyticus]GEM44876.1 lactose ABC transporter permease [Deinococcus cellulosilyticus NBRC 106333 = KACC 11606]